MKIVVFGSEKRTGFIQDQNVIDICSVTAKFLAEQKNEKNAEALASALAPSELGQFITGGDKSLDYTQQAITYLNESAMEQTGLRGQKIIFPEDQVNLHAPRAAGARVACAGGNFAEHAAAMAERAKERGERPPMEGSPLEYVKSRGFWGFWKVDRESLGQNGKILYPERTQRLDYEGELAIVIGKEGKNIRPEDVDSYIWGVTLLGDWSIRMSPEGGPLRFGMAKNFDTSCSIGPYIVVDEKKPNEIEIKTLVNGELRQNYKVSAMAFSFGEYLEFLSRDFTFYPGDLLSGGTGAGTAADASKTDDQGIPLPELFLKPGDKIEINSQQIGSLLSEVVPSKQKLSAN